MFRKLHFNFLEPNILGNARYCNSHTTFFFLNQDAQIRNEQLLGLIGTELYRKLTFIIRRYIKFGACNILLLVEIILR